MGGWDINCAICGAAFSTFDAFDNEQGEEYRFDREVIGDDDLTWLENVRVIGFNPEAFGVRKCFITGRGHDGDYGSVDCALGNDPNVPPDVNGNGELNIAVYSNYDPNKPLAIPFHQDCFYLLSKAIYHSIHGTVSEDLGKGESLETETDEVLGFVSKEVLYKALKKLYVMDSYDHCLTNVDYAELSEMVKEQYWFCFRGGEAWVSNPLTSPQLCTFFSAAHSLGLSAPPAAKTLTFTTSPSNPFTKCPKELISEILLYLSLSTLKSLALTGLLPFNLSQNNAFWHSKTNLDFPFLYDMPKLEGERHWLSIYLELDRQFYPPALRKEKNERGNDVVVGERDQSLVLGLANRRRVWGICEQIVGVYRECLKQFDDEETGIVIDKSVLEKSLSLQMPIVGNPVGSSGKAISVYFISKWENLKRELELGFWFEKEDGALCGVEVKGMGTFGKGTGGREEVVVDEGKWIVGLVINVSGGSENALKDVKIGVTGVEVILDDGSSIKVGDQKGDKRLFEVNDGMVITGLIGELDNGTIKRLGLLQAPDPNSTTTTTPSKAISPTLKPLWHTSLPPSNIHATPYATGYWTPSRSYDTIPMSFILFSPGGTYDNLSKLRGIESDPRMRCWGVEYNEREAKKTGPQDKMDRVRCFEIDGKGGERVVKVEIGMNSLVQGVKITTNKNRFAFFGHTQKNSHREYLETESAFIAGLYISWGYGDNRRVCSTISILSAARPGYKYEEGKIEGRVVGEVWNPECERRGKENEDAYMALVDEEGRRGYEGKHW